MRRIATAAALLSLPACTVGPDYAGPPRTPAARFVRAGAATPSAAPALARWWEALGDATLTALVDDALAHSPTIDQARARIAQAGAQLTQQRAAQLPSVSANGSYLNARIPAIDGDGGATDLGFYNAGLNASWELDLFGGGRRRLEQGRAGVGARVADLADVQVSLSAQVAQAYVGLRDVQDRIRLNRRISDLQAEGLALTQRRHAGGTVSLLDVERAQNQLDTSRAQAVPLAAQRDGFLNQLAVLTGRVPGALDAQLAGIVPVPLPPAVVPVGDPARLIAQRPDIRSAERQLAASTAAVGVSKARELPGIRFLGLLGLGGTSPGDVFDPGKLTTLAAPMLSWSLLDFGKARGATREAEAGVALAEAQYRQSVLAALEDAETALSRFANNRDQLGRLAQAEASATRAARLNALRVAAGTSATVDQLDIERQQVAAMIAVAQARAQLTDSYIAVQKALGLGWVEAR